MAVTQPPKILRIGVFQGKQCIEERLLQKKEDINFGREDGNHFVVISSSMPKSHTLFVYDSTKDLYFLNVRKGMGGRLALRKDEIIDLKALDDCAEASKRGNSYRIQLNPHSRGRVVIGKTVVLFQFVQPPDEAGAQILANKGGGFLGRLGEFLSVGLIIALLLSLTIHLVPLMYVVLQDWPRNDEDLAILPDWFLRMENIVQVEDEEDPQDQDDVDADDLGAGALEEEVPETAPTPSVKPSPQPSDQAPVSAAVRQERRDEGKKLIAGIFGVEGGAELSTIGDDLARRAGAVSAFGDLTREDFIGPGGGGTGQGLNLGSVGSPTAESGPKRLDGVSGGAVQGSETKVAAPTREKVQIKMSDQTSIPDRVDASDRAALEKVMAKKKIDIERCYQRVIQEYGAKPGRLVAKITVGKDGKVIKVEITEDQVGNGLTACVEAKIKIWKFPNLDSNVVFMKRWIFG